ncbi:hypothetical protein EDB85DRAFT_442489 [Lactarius pseudohatsudake]|nr:hypothetical protein EDB85DRAFT_442489 [Lactarius pseudohatsudake]
MSTTPTVYCDQFLGNFSLHPYADVILRSSDSRDFRVQKFYVIDSSPVLGEQIMAATSQRCHRVGPEATSEAPCEATTMDGETLLPVVQLPENSIILAALLSFVFPVPSALPPTIGQVLELLSVAQKYEMTNTLVRIRDCVSGRHPNFIRAETALGVYSLAWGYGLFEEALRAAEETLKTPMTIDNYEDKLNIIPIPALCELWNYRLQVLDNLCTDFVTDFSQSEVYKSLANISCVEICESFETPLWLDRYIDSVFEDPTHLDLTTFLLALSSHVSSTGAGTGNFSGGCKHCASIPGKMIRRFWTTLTGFVYRCVKNAGSEFILIQDETDTQSPIDTTMGDPPLPEGLNMQGADVILQSHDLVSFRVHKSILAISSPFFADLFSLPQPPDDTVIDGLPIVQVSEDAELLHSLLTVLYPIPSVIPDSYEKTLALLAALQKYNMDTALPPVRSEIGRQLPTTIEAFRAYAIASSKQLIPEMEIAARFTLDHPMTFEAMADALHLFEGSALHDLVRFRKRCRDNLLSFFERFISGNDSLSKSWYGCRRTKRPHTSLQNDQGILAGWLHALILRHIKSLRAAYTCSLPNHSSLRKEFVAALRAHICETHCPSCSMLYAADGEALHEQLLHRASRARDKEPFRLDAGAPNSSGDLGNTNT